MGSIQEQKHKVLELTKEMKQKILLTEGEGKAYYEESELEKMKNKKAILAIRSKNKALRSRIHEAMQGEERACERVLHQERRRHSSAGGATTVMSMKSPATQSQLGHSSRITSAANTLEQTEYKLHDMAKKLNSLQHTKTKCELRLRNLQSKLLPPGKNLLEEEQNLVHRLREDHVALENELERTKVQVTEAHMVKKHYDGMLAALKGESAQHTTALDALHVKLKKNKVALKKLKESREAAERTRDSLKAKLHEEETAAYEARRERERRIAEFRQRAEERRVSQIAAGVGGPLDRQMTLLRSPGRRDSADENGMDDGQMNEKTDQELEKYLGIFAQMKDILGVTTVEAVIDRVTSQCSTKAHLDQLKEVATDDLKVAVEEREQLQDELAKLKYATTENTSRERKEEETVRASWSIVEKKLNAVTSRRDDVIKHLVSASVSLMHVAEKLEDLMCQKVARNSSVVQQAVALFDFCEAGIVLLMEKLSEKEAMEDENPLDDSEGLVVSMENIRVSLPKSKKQQQQIAQQDDESGDEEATARRTLKRTSQMVVEAKARKRNRPVTTSFRS